uniref:Uncharacterized protein n=1 Tax=Oryza punctata TaxID=4537 RepID=A0A0E0KPD6_ORYPU
MSLDRRVHVTLLAVLALAGAVAAAAVEDGGDDARSRIGATAAAAGETVVHRRMLASSIQDSVLNANKPACLRSCSAAGRPYTGRGCTNAYQCKS